MSRPKHVEADVRPAEPVVLRRRRTARAARARGRGARRRVRRGDRGPRPSRQATYEAQPVPVVRQLLRMRRLSRRVPGGSGDQAGRRATATCTTTTSAPAARSATSSARCTRSRCSRSPSEPRDARRKRGRGLGRLPAQRGLLHLPDHAVVDDGRAGRRVGERRAGPTSGAPCPHVVEMQSEGGAAGSLHGALQGGRAVDDVHRLTGPAADDPQHVQDRRRADARA